jgi:Vitamin K-dependent gamma-carboxylase
MTDSSTVNESTGDEGDFASGLRRLIAKLVDDVDALPLRVFEIVFTLSALLKMSWQFISWEEWLTDEGFHATAAELAPLGYPAPFPLLTVSGVVILCLLIIASALGIILNRWRRLALGVFLGCLLYVQGVDWFSAFTNNKLYVGVFSLLLLTPGYRRDAESGRLIISAVAVRLVQGTLIAQYLAAGVSKAFRGDWLKHSDVLYTQIQGIFRTEFAAWCLRHLPLWAWTVMRWVSLLFELEAPVLFTVRRLRWIAFVVGLGFHLMIALMMKNLIFFSAQMWTFYALFVSGDEWRAIGRRLDLRIAKRTLQ